MRALAKIRRETLPVLAIDLGGVLVFFDHWKTCRAVEEKYDIPAGFVHKAIFLGGIERSFDKGESMPKDFLAQCEEALGIRLDGPWFKNAWSDIFTPNRPVIRLLAELAPDYRLILCSNTNEWHYEQAAKLVPLLTEFDALVLSYRVGAVKPDPLFFESLLGIAGHRTPVYFVDDVPAFVGSAESFGFKGSVYCNPINLHSTIQRWRTTCLPRRI